MNGRLGKQNWRLTASIENFERETKFVSSFRKNIYNAFLTDAKYVTILLISSKSIDLLVSIMAIVVYGTFQSETNRM